MSLKTLDVAIGAVFLFLLLTFVASAILEIVARGWNWRAKNLHAAVEIMLEGTHLVTAKDVFNNPMVLALSQRAGSIPRMDILERMGWRERKDRTPPSYIPAATFSAAVLEVILKKAGNSERNHRDKSLTVRLPELSPEGAIKAVREVVGTQANSTSALLSVLITTLASQGSSIQAVRFAIEKWFDQTMDRASGWYKRRTQSFLLAFGLLIAFLGNVDTIAVVQWLWGSDSARQAVLVAATNYENQVHPGSKPAAGYGTTDPVFQNLADRIQKADQEISKLQYPIGWDLEPKVWLSKLKAKQWPLKRKTESSYPQYFLGCLITAIAISMGSTFWFDSLQKLLSIRSSGPKPAR